MNTNNLEIELIKYANNVEDPETNFNLALEYFKLNQIASSVSHFLRCAERSNDKLLQYECMILGGLGIKKQGYRLYTEKSFFQNAIALIPNRPEAYLYIADTFSKLNQNHNAYTMISIGENLSKNEYTKLKTKLPYNGILEFKHKKLLYSKKIGMTILDEDLEFLNNLQIKLD